MEFSVLMSLCDKERPEHLMRALDSVIYQTVTASEIVLIKDGPLKEELDEIVHIYSRKYPELFRVFSFEENMGLGRALKFGVEQCRYDIIARMDTDDISKRKRFEKQLSVLEENPKIDVLSSWIEEFQGNEGNIVDEKRIPETQADIYEYAKSRNPVNHPVVMFKKKAVLDAGNYMEFPYNEDYYLWGRMLAAGYKFYNIQENLLKFRNSKKTFKRRGGWKYAKQDVRLQKKFYEIGLIKRHKMFENILIRVSVRLLPNFLRKIVYHDLLREKN